MNKPKAKVIGLPFTFSKIDFLIKPLKIMITVAFDIGTNTFLMVIGKMKIDGWHILHDAHAIARLGEGVDTTGRISEEAYLRAEAIAKDFALLCKKYRVTYSVGVATSAVRDSENGKEVCERLSSVLGCKIQCISGDSEARYSFIGTSESLELKTVIDIGGGSTEYITGENNRISLRQSLQIGAVRLHERYLKGLPPEAQNIEAARAEVRKQLAGLPQAGVLDTKTSIGEIVGVGGTFTTLAAIDLQLTAFDSERVHNHTMSAEAVSTMTQYLLTSPLEVLLQNPAIHPKRADILPAGAIILEESLAFFGVSSCKASTKGLRYGVLYQSVF